MVKLVDREGLNLAEGGIELLFEVSDVVVKLFDVIIFLGYDRFEIVVFPFLPVVDHVNIILFFQILL